MRTSRLVLAILLTWLVFPAAAQDEWLAIEGGIVFDGTGAVHRNAVILVRGDKIEKVGPASEVRIPAEAKRFDARGKFIQPGYVDLHFHYTPLRSPRLPLMFLANGATTLREMGGWIDDNKKSLADTRARGLPTPRLLYSGPQLDGTPPAYPDDVAVLLDEMDARRVTNSWIDQGATSLKVYFRLPLGLMKVVIEEADKRNIPVHAHLEIVDPRDAIRVGLDGFEHVTSVGQALLSPREAEAYRQEVLLDNNARRPGRYRVWAKIDPEGEKADALIRLMLEHNVNLDATLAIFEPPRGRPGNEEKWKAVRNMGAFTVRYHQAGGSVSIGSHGTVENAAPGYALQRELEAHVEAGMSPSDVLQAATRGGAEALRLSDRGVLAPGKLADITILDADPLEDISNVTLVHAIILGGKVIDRAPLLRRQRPPARTGETLPVPVR